MAGINRFIVHKKIEEIVGDVKSSVYFFSTITVAEHLTPNSASAGRGIKLIIAYIKNTDIKPSK